MLAARKDTPYQVIAATLASIVVSSAMMSSVPEAIDHVTAQPKSFHGDHARIANTAELPLTF
jgi:hypothetical protein